MAELKSHEVLSKLSPLIEALSKLDPLIEFLPERHTIPLKWTETVESGAVVAEDIHEDANNFLSKLYNNPYLNVAAMFCPDIDPTNTYLKFLPLSVVFKTSSYLILRFVDEVEGYVWNLQYHPGTGVIYFTSDHVLGDEYSGPIGSESSLTIYSF